MPQRAYLETSVVSYLAGRPSRDLVVAARQQLTHEWWRRRRTAFELYVSELVLAEAAAGDPEIAARRIKLVEGLPTLSITAEASELARFLVRAVGLPPKARADALHIALAACHGIEYLLTWNSTHIANAELRPRVEAGCRQRGYDPPVLCTPDELMGA